MMPQDGKEKRKPAEMRDYGDRNQHRGHAKLGDQAHAAKPGPAGMSEGETTMPPA
jgi:hypothetical protein